VRFRLVGAAYKATKKPNTSAINTLRLLPWLFTKIISCEKVLAYSSE
jgi:hypothetical protein